MEHKRDIHGHVVYGGDDVKEGLNYLDYDLQTPEAEVFFKQAKLKGSAQFEDDHERQFTLVFDRMKTAYRIERRTGGGGGWF